MGDLLVLLYLTERMKDIDYQIISYKNSGDMAYKDKTRVVGYFAISIAKNKKNLSLQKPKKQNF